MFKAKNSIGMTFIELMLGLVLSVFIISSIFTLYLSAENNRLVQKSMINLQENAQILGRILQSHIHLTAYRGCAQLTADFPFKNNLPIEISLKNKIEYYQDKHAYPGTDAIKIWHLGSYEAVLLKPMPEDSILYVTSGLRVKVDDDLIISDCKSATTFRVKQVTLLNNGMQKIASSTPFDKLYEPGSRINKLEVERYFVGTTERLDKNNLPVHALYVIDSANNKTELVEGVDDMQIWADILENNQLVTRSIEEVHDAAQIKGVEFAFKLTALPSPIRHKRWYLYAALS